MTTLFLQRIEISNFRAYGDNFSLSLPGPGVTILTGPDGLGKSTFFEAIEWALTGRVRRLEALTQESLDRGRNNGLLARREKDVPVAQYGVSLEFVNGEGKSTRIERRAALEQANREQFAEVSSPTQQQLIDLLRAGSWLNEIGDIGEYLRPTHLRQAIEQAATALMERKRVLSQAEETLNAWQLLDSTAAEFKRDTLLRLSAARMKIAHGVTEKSSAAARIDRHTHEMWMIQPYLHDTTKTIQRIKDLDSRIRSLLLVKQEPRTQLELEAAQATRNQLPDLEYLHDYQAGINARTAQLSSAIKEEHKVVAQIEEELLAAHALQQQYPELLSALGTLPSDEANAISEAVRAVEQLAHHERQQIASLRQRWLELGLQGFPSHGALDDQRSKLAEQESELQQLRELQERLTDTWPAWQKEEAYWWSRWSALLLDEPLQPHDLTHAAAFLEVLRTLVRDRKYQVVLSIHDEELADSMRRKMEVAGIECVTCRYRGLGPTGVLYSTV